MTNTTSGHVCVVTGAAAGIGKAIAEELVNAGWSVVGLDRNRATVSGFELLVGDVTEDGDLERAARVASKRGDLLGWVNNAAVPINGLLDELDPETVRAAIEVNLMATITGCRIALREMRMAPGSAAIVNVSSLQASQSIRGCAVYAAAKAGIEGLTRGLAVDYGDVGIRVNAVAPGTIATEQFHADLATVDPTHRTSYEQGLAEVHALARIGTPAEVASVVAFLLSDKAANITGATIPVDGGRSVYAYERPWLP
jgi:NAD(P)-dependent dehydrogenase (short-subunit alcohol dehydrogenase family)